jgi:hypothetical protein
VAAMTTSAKIGNFIALTHLPLFYWESEG